MQTVTDECRCEIISYGRKVADEILSQKDSNAASDKACEAQDNITRIADDYSKKIAECVQKFASDVATNMNHYENSHYVQQVNKDFLKQLNLDNSVGLAGKIGTAIGSGGVTGCTWLIQNGASFFATLAKTSPTPLGNALAGGTGLAVKYFGGTQ